MGNVVNIDNVSKAYGTGDGLVRALSEVDFSVPEGQFLSIMGPSGCGKSTLLNLMAGLDEPDSGHVILEGRDLSGLDDDARSEIRLRRVGFIFQGFNLLPRLSVLRNVEWRLKLSGLLGVEAEARSIAVLQEVGVPE